MRDTPRQRRLLRPVRSRPSIVAEPPPIGAWAPDRAPETA